MEVKLVSKSTDIVNVISSATRATRTGKPMDAFMDEWDYPDGMDRESYVQDVLGQGHEGIAEFAWYVFSVSGISRVMTHQLVRHRIASYLQMSSRHTNVSRGGIIMPPSVEKNEKARSLFQDAERSIFVTYSRLRDEGISKEDARFIVPDGITTHIVVGMNARELCHFFRLRLCHNAQWEIRQFAEEVLAIVRESDPCIFLGTEVPCISDRCTGNSSDCDFFESDEYAKRKSEYQQRIEEFERVHTRNADAKKI